MARSNSLESAGVWSNSLLLSGESCGGSRGSPDRLTRNGSRKQAHREPAAAPIEDATRLRRAPASGHRGKPVGHTVSGVPVDGSERLSYQAVHRPLGATELSTSIAASISADVA